MKELISTILQKLKECNTINFWITTLYSLMFMFFRIISVYVVYLISKKLYDSPFVHINSTNASLIEEEALIFGMPIVSMIIITALNFVMLWAAYEKNKQARTLLYGGLIVISGFVVLVNIIFYLAFLDELVLYIVFLEIAIIIGTSIVLTINCVDKNLFTPRPLTQIRVYNNETPLHLNMSEYDDL